MTRACARCRSPRQGSLSSEARAAPVFDPHNPGLEQLRRLTGISRALTYTTSLDQVTRLTVERGAELLDAAAAVLMLTDSDGLLQVCAAHGINETLLERFHAPLTDDLIRRLQGLLAAPVDRFLAVPLVVGGEVTGLVGVSMNREANPADEWLLSALADQAAVALENARLSDAVHAEMGERLRARDDASARDRALSTLAHDIRTPLGAIDGYCGILEAEIYGDINDRQRETLGRVRMSGRHLLSLLDNVMDMARLNAGVVRVSAEPVRLAEVAREALEMLLPSAGARLQSLGVRELQDVVVTADHDRLRQVLVNLVGNAVKFTPPDGTITITAGSCTVDGADFGEIRVTDNGPGVPLSEQAAIFEPYYRSEVTSGTAGVGLGLAIAQGLIVQMGGTLTLDSAPGAGSTFIVRLPC